MISASPKQEGGARDTPMSQYKQSINLVVTFSASFSAYIIIQISKAMLDTVLTQDRNSPRFFSLRETWRLPLIHQLERKTRLPYLIKDNYNNSAI